MTSGAYEVYAIGSRGDGLIDVSGDVHFIPKGAIGDIAHIKEDGSLDRVEPGAHRGEARCSQADKCGGCNMQHLGDDDYADWLRVPIQRALEQQGLEGTILAPIVTPPQTRRRCMLSGRWQGKDFILGFAQERSHTITPLKDCAVLNAVIFSLIKPLEGLLRPYVHKKRAARVQLSHASNGVDIVLEGADFADMNLRQDIAGFAQSHDAVIRIIGLDQGYQDILWQTDTPIMRFGGGTVPLPAGVFTQATPQGEAALVKTLLSWLDEPKSIVDLFSGIGTFSIPLTAAAKVHAFEGSRDAVKALQAAQLQKGRHGVAVTHRDLFRRPLKPEDLEAYDCIVLDPPRAGAKSQCAEIAKSRCPQVLFVSCNANSFARDAKILVEGGYTLQEIQPVGQFLWSTHVELAARFTR